MFWFCIAWDGFRIESTLATVMTGDPSDVLETAALIVELYCHLMVGAGLPFAEHVRFAVMPAVINVDAFIDSLSFRDTEARNVKENVEIGQNYILMISSINTIALITFFTLWFHW